jgi:hypothetical protein
MATRPGPGDGFEQVLPPRRPGAVPRGARRELGRFWERFPGGGVWLAPGLGAVALLALLLHLWRPPGEPLVDAGGVDDVDAGSRAASSSTTTTTWDVLLPDVTLDDRVFSHGTSGTRAALGFACRRAAIPRAAAEPVSITRFEPVTTRPESVHHITVFGCDARVVERWPEVSFGRPCAGWDFAKASSSSSSSSSSSTTSADGGGVDAAPCRVVLYAYDKGAEAFEAPEGMAVKAGAGTGITHVMYQVHYLVAAGGKDASGGGDENESVAGAGARPPRPTGTGGGFAPAPWTDASGVRFDLAFGDAAARRPTSIGILAAMHTRMRIPGGRSEVAFEYTLGPFARRLAPDFDFDAAAVSAGREDDSREDHRSDLLGPSVTLFAAHLHGHGMVRRYETGVFRGGDRTRREPFAAIAPYGGYGRDQSYKPLPLEASSEETLPGDRSSRKRSNAPGGFSMGPEDVMYVRCVFDTSHLDAGSWVTYGVGDGEEMCGQLVYYHPFVAREGRRGPGPGPGPGGVAGLARPEPGDEPNERDRDNDLYNVLFNVTEGLAS